MDRVVAYVLADKTVITPGVEYNSVLTEIYRAGDYRVWHHTGGTHWGGHYQPRPYHAASVTLWHVDSSEPRTERHREIGSSDVYEHLSKIEEVEPGKRWRQVQRQMRERAAHLAAEDQRRIAAGGTPPYDHGGVSLGDPQAQGGAGPAPGLLEGGDRDSPEGQPASGTDHPGPGRATDRGPADDRSVDGGHGDGPGPRADLPETWVFPTPEAPRPRIIRPSISHTHTYAVLEISQAAWDEIEAYLLDASYDHALTAPGLIDMHGIALQRSADVADRAKGRG